MAGNSLDYDGNISLDDYKKSSKQNAHQKRRIDLIDRLLDKIPVIGEGLDYGCGLGDITYRISHRFKNIVGVDVTPERVEWANKEFSPISFYQCDGENLDFPNNLFDTVLSSVVINWVEDPEKYLENIHRKLKTDGHLVIIVKAPNRIRDYFRGILGKVSTRDSDFSLEKMEEMLLHSDFEILEVDCYYEPPGDLFTNYKNILIEMLSIPMRIFRIPKYSSYYGILAKTSIDRGR